MSIEVSRCLLAIFVALIASFGLGYGAGAYFDGQAAVPTFAKVQRGHLRRLDASSAPGRVVFLGSSTFQGMDVSMVTPIGLNLSMGGDTLAGLIARSSRYRALSTAQAVVVNIGLNDLIQECAEPDSRIEDLFDHVRAQAPIVLVGVQQVSPARYGGHCDGALRGLIDKYNSTLKRACQLRADCHFVPHPIQANADPSHQQLQDSDGVHLSPLGYATLASILRSALNVKQGHLAAKH